MSTETAPNTVGPAAASPQAERPASHPRQRAARIAGASYLAMVLLAIFANFVVREGLIEPGDAVGTVASITESIGLFRLGLVAFLAIFVLDVVIAWALHVVFRDVNHDLSLATAWFRLIYTAYSVLLSSRCSRCIQLLGGESLGFLTSDQVNAQTMIELAAFESTWLIGFVAFGIHLVMLGVLVVRSGLVAKALGYFLIAAGVAYVLDTLAHVMLADYEAVASLLLGVVGFTSLFGEGWLAFWLLLTKELKN